MATQAISPGQLTFDDLFRAVYTPVPQFSKGDPIYIRSLDVILRGTVGYSYICGAKEEKPYYGYSVDFERLHTCVWDHSIGDIAFHREQDAQRKADSLYFDKILPEQIVTEDCRAFEYTRNLDNHRLTATIGKIGDCKLYEQEFMCYHFIRTYPNQKKRDEAYRKLLKKMERECTECEGREVEPVFDTLYRVTKDLYASRRYAEHNGVKGAQK